MKCPVCKTECNDNAVCETCGFLEVGKVFINQEEAEQWYESVVIPYRNRFNNANILPPIDWAEIFKKNVQAKQLFEFSIPAATKRRIDLDLLKDPLDDDYNEYLKDATLSHFAVVSKSEMIRKHFFEALNKAYLCTTDFSRTTSACVEREGDLAAMLTGLEHGSTLMVEFNSKMKKDVVKLLSKALREYCVDIVIGKGLGARNIRMDLSVFTAIFIAESIDDIPMDIRNILNDIIEINLSQEELDELQIRELAPLYNIQLTKQTLEVIKEYNSKKIFKNIKGILKFISDYLYLHSEIQQPISAENLKKIMETLS